ncbi:MAG: alpha/beta hydrolase [Gemmatimonadales bacterium]
MPRPSSSSPEQTRHHLTVPRTARYLTLGSPVGAREVWFVCHGYGQLAADFLRGFGPAAAPDRLIVAPEGLSRFYHDQGRGPVGASWMTREDRDQEITDYVRYLDLLYERVFSELDRDGAHCTAFGFSQGVATVARWAVHGRSRMDTLVVWAGGFPPEIDLVQTAPVWQRLRMVFVAGARDRIVAPDVVARQQQRFLEAGYSADFHRFDGGHRLDRAVLSRLATPR